MRTRKIWVAALAIAGVAALPLMMGGAVQADDEVLATGAFEGRSNHTTTGVVSVKRTAEGVIVVLEDSFSFDGAPDPKLGFGKGGYDPTSKFSPLRANSGEQVYDLPASVDPDGYDEIWVWCEQYSVPLGVAKLKRE
jgi:hypothetical protein